MARTGYNELGMLLGMMVGPKQRNLWKLSFLTLGAGLERDQDERRCINIHGQRVKDGSSPHEYRQ